MLVKDETGGNVHVEVSNRVGRVKGAGTSFEAVPSSLQIECELMQCFGAPRLCSARSHNEIFFQCFEQTFGRVGAEVFDEAVVVQNGQFVGGEADSHVEIIFLRAVRVGICFVQFVCHAGSCCAAVVTVGDVEAGHLLKLRSDELDVCFIAHDPKLMAEAVNGCDEIIDRLLSGIFLSQREEFFSRLEGEKDRFHVCTDGADVAHAVLFFVSACEFMFFDDAVEIVGCGGTNDPAELRASVHGLCVEIVARLVLFDEPSVLTELVELLCGAVIDSLIVFIRSGLKVDFGFDDVIERFGIPFSLLSCFF